MKIDWIEPGVLAASGIPINQADLQSLRDQGVGAVVSFTEHPLTTFREITPATFDTLGLTYFHAPIDDGHPPDLETTRNVLSFIDAMTTQGKATLVHCHAGIGRTGTMLHAYYVGRGISLDEAKKKVRASRPACAFLILSESQRAFLTDFATLTASGS
ncbi:MAG: dual specificity protein phosphatase family protein [Chloroflexota bacterium]